MSALGAAREERGAATTSASGLARTLPGHEHRGNRVSARAHGAIKLERPAAHGRTHARLGGRLGAHRPRQPHPAACTPVLASARPRGRPWSSLRAWRGDRELTLGQSRHGGQDAGLGEGWAQKRAHRGGRARADEVCTRARGAFCRRLSGAPGRRPLMRDVIAAGFLSLMRQKFVAYAFCRTCDKFSSHVRHECVCVFSKPV